MAARAPSRSATGPWRPAGRFLWCAQIAPLAVDWAMSARPALALGAHRMRCRVLAPAGVGRPGGRRQAALQRRCTCRRACMCATRALQPTLLAGGPRRQVRATAVRSSPSTPPRLRSRPQVVLLARWRTQAALKLPGVLMLALLQGGGLLAADVTQRGSSAGDMADLDAEHIARWGAGPCSSNSPAALGRHISRRPLASTRLWHYAAPDGGGGMQHAAPGLLAACRTPRCPALPSC